MSVNAGAKAAFQAVTGTRFQFVPYRGAAPAMQDLLAGQIDLEVGDAIRTFVVRIPKADSRTPAPVVFLFHPFGMNTQYMQGRVPIPRVWPEAIAVYGQGLPRTGGAGGGLQPAWQTRPGEMDDRDLAYFDAIGAVGPRAAGDDVAGLG